MASIMKVPKAGSGVRNKHSVQTPKVARNPNPGVSCRERRGREKRGRHSTEGRCSSRRERCSVLVTITAERAITGRRSDTTSTGFSDKMDGEDPEAVPKDVNRGVWESGTFSL